MDRLPRLSRLCPTRTIWLTHTNTPTTNNQPNDDNDSLTPNPNTKTNSKTNTNHTLKLNNKNKDDTTNTLVQASPNLNLVPTWAKLTSITQTIHSSCKHHINVTPNKHMASTHHNKHCLFSNPIQLTTTTDKPSIPHHDKALTAWATDFLTTYIWDNFFLSWRITWTLSALVYYEGHRPKHNNNLKG